MKIGEIDDCLIYLNATSSLNNRLIVEKYVKGEIRAKERNGFALIDQKTQVKGLKILADAILNNNVLIRKGSTAYIKEEALHTAAWAQKALESDAISVPFLIVDLSQVEFIKPHKVGSEND